MTRIAATADFHGKFLPPDAVADCDVLVVAGDFDASPEEVEAWLECVTCEVVAVGGNADWQLRGDAWRMPWTYLEDEGEVVAGVQFYGVGWEYAHTQTELPHEIPRDTTVLVSHLPPRGILDLAPPGQHIGSERLRDEVTAVPGLMLHLFGHVHEQAGRVVQQDGVTFANCGHLGTIPPLFFDV
jgi:Icc-related predicted phosphoesterase